MGGNGQKMGLSKRRALTGERSNNTGVKASQKRAVNAKRQQEKSDTQMAIRNSRSKANARGRLSTLKSKDVKAAGISFSNGKNTAVLKRAYQGKKSTYTVTMGATSRTGLTFAGAKQSVTSMLGL